MKRRTFITGFGALTAGLAVAWQFPQTHMLGRMALARVRPRRSLAEALALYGPDARARLKSAFAEAGTTYPPKKLTLIGLKAEKRLEMWAHDSAGNRILVKSSPVLAASGRLGPKLREGDRQVPEGIYPITYLNPNSLFHLSLRIGYPHADDVKRAAAEGRDDPGGDIMIHGPGGSIGCLSIGEDAVEDIFVAAADIGIGNVTVILSPNDMRRHGRAVPPEGAPGWLATRYGRIHAALNEFRSQLPAR